MRPQLIEDMVESNQISSDEDNICPCSSKEEHEPSKLEVVGSSPTGGTKQPLTEGSKRMGVKRQ